MRLIAGIIVGIVLTVGAAYLHDSRMAPVEGQPGPQPPNAVANGQIVNWDVLGAVVREETAFARQQWDRLFRK